LVAFVASLLVVIIGVGIALAVGRRRPVGKPLTWGEAFLAGTFVFAIMTVAYGVVPHQWLDWADNKLLWRKDKLLVAISGKGVKWGQEAATFGGTGRVLINYEAIRDMIAGAIYVIFFAAQLILWAKWQKRGKKAPQLELTSTFGRPVITRPELENA
jgi:hypothetical protein